MAAEVISEMNYAYKPDYNLENASHQLDDTYVSLDIRQSQPELIVVKVIVYYIFHLRDFRTTKDQ